MSPLDEFRQFVSDSQAAAYYSKWASQNSGELARWGSFRDGLLAGQRPVAPAMTTRYGAALVDAGLIVLSGGTSFSVAITGYAIVAKTLTAVAA